LLVVHGVNADEILSYEADGDEEDESDKAGWGGGLDDGEGNKVEEDDNDNDDVDEEHRLDSPQRFRAFKTQVRADAAQGEGGN
jgi:hypothetical protein